MHDPDNAVPAWRASLGAWCAEALGTFVFVWLGTGTLLATKVLLRPNEPLNDVAISIAFGFALLVAVYALGAVSGAHFNPAVTLGLAVVRRFPWRAVPGYLVAQFVGGILAGLANWLLFGGGTAKNDLMFGATQVGPRGPGIALFAEFLITTLLMITIMGVVVDRRGPGSAASGLAVGLVVSAGIFAMLPVSGGSFNPARTLGPMIAAQSFTNWWVYIAGPVAGAVFGAALYEYVISRGRVPA